MKESITGCSKQELLNRLQVLQIHFSKYDHPVALTVEAQAKYVGHVKGALTKNLFFKDKKHRYYIVSALPDTKVDLKVLSQRLGLGKGALRMAPEEALGQLLQVPLGCVTPFALVNESARHVSLLLDQGFKNQECCFFHPLSNDTTISLSSIDLDKFLNSVGKAPAYVDLEAKPSVGKDHPPDLGFLVPSDGLILPNSLHNTGPVKNQDLDSLKPAGANAKAVKPSSSGTQNNKLVNVVKTPTSLTDPSTFIEEILEKTSSIVLTQTKEENIKQHGEELGAIVLDQIRRQLTMEFKNMATIFKNTAYTEGFHAGIHQLPRRL
ncbi:hypothetical protein LIER_29117 [Lithospermum erythrorhizon]|uniref:YbaK/aminoacyl-tRNA synthetase-associated domain-containing protein n=1 Tax=Lithospermum erythrorhizon TaxID=34254 RepID=A0AAV3RL51_LITER